MAKFDLKVFITTSAATCGECGEDLGRRAWITLVEDKGALCLACADLDHLVFLPAGDAALTRRSRKHSTLFAVVLRWSRARKRYERQGLLVEAGALEQAEQECLADEEVRARRREREAARRAVFIAGLDPDGLPGLRRGGGPPPPGAEQDRSVEADQQHRLHQDQQAQGRRPG